MLFAWYILPLIPIIYEDFRYRAIHWIWLVILSVLAICLGSINTGFVLTNLSFVLFQLVVLSLYFSIKNRELTNIVNQYLGIGDILYFIPLCLLFSPINFIGFFVTSLIISLTGALIWNVVKPGIQNNIPLAGCMSIVLIPILFMAWQFDIDLKNDLFLLHLLT